MTEESISHAVPTEPHRLLEALNVPAEASADAEAPESGTRGMLRDAIQKVMDEIEYHEREARKHRQQAEELRKDLRESVAFLQRGGRDARTPEPAEDSGKAKPADEKVQRAGAKKKPAKRQ